MATSALVHFWHSSWPVTEQTGSTLAPASKMEICIAFVIFLVNVKRDAVRHLYCRLLSYLN